MHYRTKLALIAIGLSVALAASAQTEHYPANTELQQQLCPAVTELKQNADLLWTAPDGWKSSSPSFLKTVKQFIGAQWFGVNLGEIVCIYIKGGKGDFPVHLHRPVLVASPTGGNWGQEKDGYKDCKSNDPQQCPFTIQKPYEIDNVYEQIDFFKGQAVEDNGDP